MTTKADKWIEYPSVKKFKKMIDRGRITETTLESYLKGIREFCVLLGYDNPETALEEIGKVEDKETYFDDLIGTLKEKGLSDTRITNVYKALKMWFNLNRIDIDWHSIILPSVIRKIEDRCPTKEELRRILNICNLRDKALILVASSSGLRRNALITLKVGDVDFGLSDIAKITVKREYEVEGKVYRSGRKITKTRTFFVTFITPEAKKMLLEYLEQRRQLNEKVTEESPLFTSIRLKELGQFLSKTYLDVHYGRLLKRANLAKKSGEWFELHFHTLKKYAETNFINAGVKPSYREFWLGHKGAYLESSYFRGEEVEHLKEYRKAIESLSITEKPIINKEEFRKRMLESIPKEILEAMAKKEGMETEAFKAILQKQSPVKPEHVLTRKRKSEDCQVMISEKELEGYLAKGFRYVATLPSGKILVED